MYKAVGKEGSIYLIRNADGVVDKVSENELLFCLKALSLEIDGVSFNGSELVLNLPEPEPQSSDLSNISLLELQEYINSIRGTEEFDKFKSLVESGSITFNNISDVSVLLDKDDFDEDEEDEYDLEFDDIEDLDGFEFEEEEDEVEDEEEEEVEEEPEEEFDFEEEEEVEDDVEDSEVDDSEEDFDDEGFILDDEEDLDVDNTDSKLINELRGILSTCTNQEFADKLNSVLNDCNGVLPVQDIYRILYSSEFSNIDESEKFLVESFLKDNKLDPSITSLLYTVLSAEQVSLIKRYYLWYSQSVFKDGQKDPLLRLKPNNRKAKEAKFKELNRDKGLWHYAGFIDNGYKGADHCTLGHPLRYTHLAWNVDESPIEEAFFGEGYNKDIYQAINSGNCIKFGIQCIGDFFSVDEECVRALQRAQRESLKDMEILYYFYKDGIENEVLAKFAPLASFYKKLKETVAFSALTGTKSVVDKSSLVFFDQFMSLNLVPPKSLVQSIRDGLVGWESHKFLVSKSGGMFRGSVSSDVIRNLSANTGIAEVKFLKTYEGADLLTKTFVHYLELFLKYEICAEYKYDAEVYKDEGGASRQAKYKLHQEYRTVTYSFFKDYQFTLEYLREAGKLVNRMNEYYRRGRYQDGIRDMLAIPTMKFSDSTGLWEVDNNSLSFLDCVELYSESVPEFTEAWGYLSKFSRYYDSSRLDTLEIEKENFDKYDAVIKANIDGYKALALKVLNDDMQERNNKIQENLRREEERKKHANEVLAKEKEAKKEEEAKEEAEKAKANMIISNGTSKCVSNDKELLDFITSVDFSKYTISKSNQWVVDNIVVTVRDAYKKDSNYRPSSKQLYSLTKLYNSMTGFVYNAIPDDVKDALIYADKNNLFPDSKSKGISETVLRDMVASDSQMYALKGVLEAVKKHRGF